VDHKAAGLPGDARASDPRWQERWLQTRDETREEYYAWCEREARGNMEIARKFVEMGNLEQAENHRALAQKLVGEMEKILHE
jgi:hypothetical protein